VPAETLGAVEAVQPSAVVVVQPTGPVRPVQASGPLGPVESVKPVQAVGQAHSNTVAPAVAKAVPVETVVPLVKGVPDSVSPCAHAPCSSGSKVHFRELRGDN
jgi:hypothetical protein